MRRILYGILVGLLFLVVGVVTAGAFYLDMKFDAYQKAAQESMADHLKEEQEEQVTEEPVVTPTPDPRISITISGAGDCTLGTDEHADYSTSVNAVHAQRGAAYFFENVKSVLSADDLTIVNLEGTLTTSTARADKEYAFKGDPSFVGILTEGSVEAVNIANNHSRDYGEQSYNDTVAAVEAVGIATSGYEKLALVEKNGIKIGMTGMSVTSGAATAARIQTIQTQIQELKNQGAQLVIFSCHWGIERSHEATGDQVALAHAAIDAGADLVLGHHPHILQGIEVYKGKYICYSLGNFCFGGNRNPSDKDTMIFQQTFYFDNGVLLPETAAKIIPCRLSSVSDYNDYKPTPVQGEEAERIINNLQTYSSYFGTDIRSLQ